MTEIDKQVQRVLQNMQEQAHSNASWTKNIDFPHHLTKNELARVNNTSHNMPKKSNAHP